MKKVLIIVFLIVSIGELLSLFTGMDNLHRLFKPFLMIMLGSYYLAAVSKPVRSYTVLGAILFSFLGDVFLLFQDELYFMLGLGSFLFAHIFYILAYRLHQQNEDSALLGIQKIRFALPIILAGTGLLVILYPYLGELLIPVFIYALVLVIMVLNALFRYGRTNASSFRMVFAGAILFMISDSFLAINKFMLPIHHVGIIIMTTYIAAQYLIVEGLIHHHN